MLTTTVKKIAVCCILLSCLPCAAQSGSTPFTTKSILFDQTKPDNLGLSTASGTETFKVFSPSSQTDHFSNGVVLIGFKGSLYCQWQSSKTDEDAPETRVVYSRSTDGTTWASPMTLVAPGDTGYHTTGGWWVNGDTLIAYINMWPSSLAVKGGYTQYMTSTDGLTWSTPKNLPMKDGNSLKGIFEQDPHQLPSGRIVGAAHFQPGLIVCPIYTDDPSGIRGWTKATYTNLSVSSTNSQEMEPSLFYRADNAVVMVFRDQNSSFKKLASVSLNNGSSWSKPVLTDMPDSRSKQSAGNLPDGTAFQVSNPVENKTRIPLVVSLSKDGQIFDKAFVLRKGGSDLQPQRYTGKAKTLGYNYPKSMIWKDHLYIAYSVNKEDVEYTRVPLSSLYQNPVEKCSLSVSIAQGQGSVTPASGSYIKNQSITVTATPAQGWLFYHWSGDLTGSTNPATVTMSANRSISAFFVQDTRKSYTVTTQTSPGGTITQTPEGTLLNEGTRVSFTAVPGSGWTFSGWSGDHSGTDAAYSIASLENDISIAASFVPIDKFVYQAEYGALKEAVSETKNGGFSGEAYINFNAAAASVAIPVYVDEAGEKSVNITFANGSGATRALSVSVNGIQQNASVNFEATTDWATWLTKQITLTLPRGASTITLATINNQDGPNLDKIEIVEATTTLGSVSAKGNPPGSLYKLTVNTLIIHTSAAKTKVSIFSLNGKMMFSKEFSSGVQHSGSIAIPLSDLHRGVYMIRTEHDGTVRVGQLRLMQ